MADLIMARAIKNRRVWVLASGAVLVTYGRVYQPHYTPAGQGVGQGYFVSRIDAAIALRLHKTTPETVARRPVNHSR